MARRVAYDVNAEWVDPCEIRTERRRSSRFYTNLKMTVAVDLPEICRRLVGPGIVKNLSDSGAEIVTKHRLAPRQQVTVVFSTESVPDGPCLTESFVGKAEVVRVKDAQDRCNSVALRFGESLTHDMEFALFIDHLRALSLVQTPRAFNA